MLIYVSDMAYVRHKAIVRTREILEGIVAFIQICYLQIEYLRSAFPPNSIH